MTVVDVWTVDLDAAAGTAEHHLAVLSAHEQERARRIATPAARAEFVVTRAALRRLLGRRLGVPASAVRLASGRNGKPFVAGRPELPFNVSHTRGRALLALGDRGALGIDVERIDPRVDVRGLAERCFSAAERRAFSEVPASARLRAFYDGWARKEAFVKALGTGLSHDLSSFSVTLAPDRPAMLLGRERAAWRLVALDAGSQYAAALVLPAGGPAQIRRHTWRH